MSDTASSDHMSWLTNFFGGGGDSGSSSPPAAAASPPPSSPSFLSKATSVVSSACDSVASAVQEKTGYSVTQVAKAVVVAPIVAFPALGEAVGTKIMSWKSEHDQAEAAEQNERALSQQRHQEHEQAEANKKAMQEAAERDARDEVRERARCQAEDEKTAQLMREKRAQEEEVARLQQDREEKARKALQEQDDGMRARLQPVGSN